MSWPPTGLLISAATLMIANKVPVRTPICRTSEICAMREGARDTKAPDPKPIPGSQYLSRNAVVLAIVFSGRALGTEEDGERNQISIISTRNPQREDDDSCSTCQKWNNGLDLRGALACEGTHKDHHVEASEFIRKVARYSPSEERSCVEYAHHVLSQIWVHAVMGCLENDVVNWDEHSCPSAKFGQYLSRNAVILVIMSQRRVLCCRTHP